MEVENDAAERRKITNRRDTTDPNDPEDFPASSLFGTLHV